MAVVGGMFLTPLVPIAIMPILNFGWMIVGGYFLLSMLLLMKSPGTWWTGNLFYIALLLAFLTMTIVMPAAIPDEIWKYGNVGTLLCVLVIGLLWLPSSRRYYFRIKPRRT